MKNNSKEDSKYKKINSIENNDEVFEERCLN